MYIKRMWNTEVNGRWGLGWSINSKMLRTEKKTSLENNLPMYKITHSFLVFKKNSGVLTFTVPIMDVCCSNKLGINYCYNFMGIY